MFTNEKRCGKILEIFYASPMNKVIRVRLDKEYLIPVNSPFMKKIDKKSKTLLVEILEVM